MVAPNITLVMNIADRESQPRAIGAIVAKGKLKVMLRETRIVESNTATSSIIPGFLKIGSLIPSRRANTSAKIPGIHIMDAPKKGNRGELTSPPHQKYAPIHAQVIAVVAMMAYSVFMP
jgi:hypothetical protein